MTILGNKINLVFTASPYTEDTILHIPLEITEGNITTTVNIQLCEEYDIDYFEIEEDNFKYFLSYESINYTKIDDEKYFDLFQWSLTVIYEDYGMSFEIELTDEEKRQAKEIVKKYSK